MARYASNGDIGHLSLCLQLGLGSVGRMERAGLLCSSSTARTRRCTAYATSSIRVVSIVAGKLRQNIHRLKLVIQFCFVISFSRDRSLSASMLWPEFVRPFVSVGRVCDERIGTIVSQVG